MNDRIVDDEWINIWMLECFCFGFSLIDMDSESSYQTWAMIK